MEFIITQSIGIAFIDVSVFTAPYNTNCTPKNNMWENIPSISAIKKETKPSNPFFKIANLRINAGVK